MEAASGLFLSGSTIVCHTNYDLRWMILNGCPGLSESTHFHDTKVMAFMLDQQNELALDSLVKRYLGKETWKPIRQREGRIMFQSEELGALVPIEEVPWDEMVTYNSQDLILTAELYECLRDLLSNSGQWEEFFLAEEAPLSKLLIEMEVAGMPLDAAGTRDLLERADLERQTLRKELIEETGVCGFNPNSGDAVAAFLYDELPTFKVKLEVPALASLTKQEREEAVSGMVPDGMVVERIGTKYVYGHQTVAGRGLRPPKSKMKKGVEPRRPPIDAENLVLMYGEDPWVAKYLRWKSLHTLCTNYLEKWVEAEHNGRLHGRFDQARAETGRLASRDPNLQAIPVSMDFNVRVLFRAPMVIGDYSGLDARVAAHFSEDPLMLEIYRNDMDLYGVLASEAWGGPAGKSNPNRNLMKILMLSAQYGSHAGSIGDKIRISGLGDEAARKAGKLLRQLEELLPRLFQWREEVLLEAQALGFISTISGRRRYLPELYSNEWWRRTRAERQCVASMVQGTSADIVRRCMLACRNQIPPEAAKIVLQVHDEILWERGPAWEDSMFDEIVYLCENAHNWELNLPMKFSASLGDSWEDKDAQGARSYRVMSREAS